MFLLLTVALQHSDALLRNSSGLVAQVVTTVNEGRNTVGVFSSDQLISIVPIQMSGRDTLPSSTEYRTFGFRSLPLARSPRVNQALRPTSVLTASGSHPPDGLSSCCAPESKVSIGE